MMNLEMLAFIGGFLLFVALSCAGFGRQRERIRILESQIEQLLMAERHWKNEAAKGYEERAHRGDVEAMLALGYLYKNGADSRMNKTKVAALPDSDFKEAMRWYAKAAEKGNAEAMFCLAYMHHKGITPDLTEDFQAARRWYKRAIEAGSDCSGYWLEQAEEEQKLRVHT